MTEGRHWQRYRLSAGIATVGIYPFAMTGCREMERHRRQHFVTGVRHGQVLEGGRQWLSRGFDALERNDLHRTARGGRVLHKVDLEVRHRGRVFTRLSRSRLFGCWNTGHGEHRQREYEQ